MCRGLWFAVFEKRLMRNRPEIGPKPGSWINVLIHVGVTTTPRIKNMNVYDLFMILMISCEVYDFYDGSLKRDL